MMFVNLNNRKYFAPTRPRMLMRGKVSMHAETVCLLGKRKPDSTVKLSVDMDDYYRIINGKGEK